MTKRAMQETTFLILTALAEGPQHGYGIIRDVGRISGDRVTLRAGTLCGAPEWRFRPKCFIASTTAASGCSAWKASWSSPAAT
jgi:hypothetical protein